ncbi:unnamed protein product [Gadus morhua 'NCC']
MPLCLCANDGANCSVIISSTQEEEEEEATGKEEHDLVFAPSAAGQRQVGSTGERQLAATAGPDGGPPPGLETLGSSDPAPSITRRRLSSQYNQ